MNKKETKKTTIGIAKITPEEMRKGMEKKNTKTKRVLKVKKKDFDALLLAMSRCEERKKS